MELNFVADIESDNQLLLCLKCRGAGHVVDNCPSAEWRRPLEWFFSDERAAMSFEAIPSKLENDLCHRCQELNILSLLESDLPWEAIAELDHAAKNGSPLLQSIGRTGNIQFWKNCSLCPCIFALTPNPESAEQEVIILPHWTMIRLTGELGANMDTPEKRRYARCLLVRLSPTSLDMYVPPSTSVHRGDALCVLQEDLCDGVTLGGRLIDSHQLNSKVIQEWLDYCSHHHGRYCDPVYSSDLQDIRLIDIASRTVVNYPSERIEYAALSYVWGNIVQEHFGFGSVLPKLPQTLEDAMSCAQALKFKYLWVDSLCINQQDEQDKENQVRRMCDIYRGASITLVALSGTSADAGITRFGPKNRFFPQLKCTVNGKRLVGLMPTLSQQVWHEKWGGRAWTHQEAFLSSRCLFLSDHQLYFECNVMQCCESLDQTNSWAHSLSKQSELHYNDWSTWITEQNGGGCFRNLVDPSTRILSYGYRLIAYSYRRMKHDRDSLIAFSGTLRFWESIYPEGFFWGLPIADLQWALLWVAQFPPRHRSNECPSWSWTRWDVGLFQTFPRDHTKPKQYAAHLSVSIFVQGRAKLIFAAGKADLSESAKILFNEDPVNKAAAGPIDFPANFNPIWIVLAERKGWLFLEAISLDLPLDFSNPVRENQRTNRVERFALVIGGITCYIEIMGNNPLVDRQGKAREDDLYDLFLLLARDRANGNIMHHLLLVNVPHSDHFARRETVLSLIVPEGSLAVLENLKPRRRCVVLI